MCHCTVHSSNTKKFLKPTKRKESRFGGGVLQKPVGKWRMMCDTKKYIFSQVYAMAGYIQIYTKQQYTDRLYSRVCIFWKGKIKFSTGILFVIFLCTQPSCHSKHGDREKCSSSNNSCSGDGYSTASSGITIQYTECHPKYISGDDVLLFVHNVHEVLSL